VWELAQVAWIFPGQGCQYPGMGKQLYDSYAVARETFDTADRVLGFRLSELVFHGPSDELTLTHNAQPAILVVSVACARVLESHGLRPEMAAGFSLGEYTALVVSGSLGFEDAVVLTRRRGMYMQEVCPPGKGSMAAIIGMAYAELEAICFASSKHGVVMGANYNCPGQIVISGEARAVAHVCKAVQERGGRAIPIPVSAPFHCPLMEPAARRLQGDLDAISVKPPSVPVYANVTGKRVSTTGEIRQALIRQVTSPVLWQVAVENMISDGARLFIEVGPGKVLSGFGRRINPKVRFMKFSAPEDLDDVLDSHQEAWLE
jgi:[acyl-carrier-protein] S-malonyltransferase